MVAEELAYLHEQEVSLTLLRLMHYLRYPRRYAEIYQDTTIDRSTVRKYMVKYPELIQKIPLPVDTFVRERGKPPVAIILGPEGRKAIETLFKVRVITAIN